MSSQVSITLTPEQQEFILGNLRHIDADVKPLEGGDYDQVATMVHKATRGIYEVLNERHKVALQHSAE